MTQCSKCNSKNVYKLNSGRVICKDCGNSFIKNEQTQNKITKNDIFLTKLINPKVPITKRPSIIAPLLICGLIALCVGGFIASFFEEGENRAIIGLVSLITGPSIGYLFHLRNLSFYQQYRLSEYQKAKDQLRANPDDLSLREAMLLKGRQYYSSLRGDETITIYDEQAISNDMKAILG